MSESNSTDLAFTIRQWLDTYDKRQREDHDVITRLETKFDQMAFDIKSLAEGLTVRVAKLEEHKESSDKLISDIKPYEAIKTLERHEQYIHDQMHTSHLVKGAVNILWMVLGTLVALVVEWIRTNH